MAEWKIKRDDREFTAPDAATLAAWTKAGRVRPSDYVLNPTLERWMYAREVAELAPLFDVPPQLTDHAQREKAKSRGCMIALALTAWAILFGFFADAAPCALAAGVCFIGAIGVTIAWLVKYQM